jgi:RNA polymerase sigma factor (sigma-70 family)
VDDPEPELLRRALASDESARALLLDQHLAGLRAFVHLRLGRALRAKEESQDLVQSVCREVLSDLPQFVPRRGASFRDWVLSTAENKIRARWRHWRRERRDVAREVELDETQADDAARCAELAELVTPSRHAASREELSRLERAFSNLPSDYREVIVLARLRGWPHARIAEHLGRTELATRTLLSRALARLALSMHGS